jgi:hypothetical protein
MIEMSTSDTIGVWNVVAQFVVAVVAIGAVIVALITSNRQIKENRNQQAKQIEENRNQQAKQIEESRRLATEERQHQSCPIIVPTKAIANVPAKQVPGIQQQYLYTSEVPPLKGNISWGLQFSAVPIEVSNIGMGPAFNIHCVLHGYDDIYINQFISWNNGPIGAGKDETILTRHPFQDELWLDRNDSVNGEHTLHYPPVAPNPKQAQARLTISYQDLFDNKLVSIFDYTPYHQWVRVFVSMPSSPKIALDLKELNDQKNRRLHDTSGKQHAPS